MKFEDLTLTQWIEALGKLGLVVIVNYVPGSNPPEGTFGPFITDSALAAAVGSLSARIDVVGLLVIPSGDAVQDILSQDKPLPRVDWNVQ